MGAFRGVNVRLLSAMIFFGCVCAVASEAAAQDPSPCRLAEREEQSFRQLFGEAKLAQIEEQHKRAVTLFKRAYLMCADPEILWWLSLSYEADGDLSRAQSYIQAHLKELGPERLQRKEEALARLSSLSRRAPGVGGGSSQVERLSLGKDGASAAPNPQIPSINLGGTSRMIEPKAREEVPMLKPETVGTPDKGVTALKLDDVALAHEAQGSQDRSLLTIETDPAGAQVFIDLEQGSPLAITPTTALALVPQRRYRVIILKPGYQRLEREILMERDANKKLYFTLIAQPPTPKPR